MKYKEEYLRTENKEEFIKLASEYYTYVKRRTLIRRFYDLRKKLGKQLPKLPEASSVIEIPHKVVTDDDVVVEPDTMKKLRLKDMKRMGYKLNYDFLRRYGFTKGEINWLIKNGELE